MCPLFGCRHEHFLAAKLGLKPGHKARCWSCRESNGAAEARGFEVADLGMGVGGPLRSFAEGCYGLWTMKILSCS